MNIEKNLTTSGKRLRRARILAGLTTRREFEKKYKISANTLQGWEQGKNPLSEKGAKRVIEAFKYEGLLCSVEWLMNGTGMPPRPFELVQAGIKESYRADSTITDFNLREEEAIYKEMQTFKERVGNSIILAIADDAMESYYAIGDYIGGSRIFGEEIKQYIGNTCIVELENNIIVPRVLHAGKSEGTYTLSCTNPKTTAFPLNLYNIKINSAAPILWHRRKLSALKR